MKAMAINAAETVPAPAPDDGTLAARARAGDREAFAALVERHYDFIHRVAWQWCRSRVDAEDIAQTVCSRLGTSIRSWRGDGALTTWLYRLTINAAHDAARSASRERRKAAAWETHALASGLDRVGGEADEAEGNALWEAVRMLADKQRDAVLLVYGEGMSHGEAASIMDCAESTVSYHVFEAKKKLKKLLRQ
jgi:RNA polymerase sigma-70 factor (ECF subfamily)